MATLDQLLATAAREGPAGLPAAVSGPPPRRAGGGGVQYRPLERRTLENLLVALQAGLQPEIGLGMYQDVQQSALDRLLLQRQKAAAAREARQTVLPEAIDTAASYAAAGLPSGLAEAAYSGFGPGIQNQLGGAIEELYPGGVATSPYGAEGAGAGALDAESLANIDADLQAAIGQGRDLHTTRMAIMTRLRMLEVPEPTLQQVYDYIGQQWTTLGGVGPEGAEGADVAASNAGAGVGAGIGGAIGGVAGTFVGHPVLGALAGSAIGGYVGGQPRIGATLGEKALATPEFRNRLEEMLRRGGLGGQG